MIAPIVSVIIPTHNSAATLARCIESITSQSSPREYCEIIVVDDGSKDDTVLIAQTAGVDKLIVTEPCFQGKARNIGAKNSRSNIIAFIDSDCEAKNDWIRAIIRELQPMCAISGPIENGNPQSLVAWAEYFIEFGGWDEHKKRSSIRLLPGCNGACTKEDFQRAGRFIESEASEDVLFGASLKKAGVSLYFIPEMQIRHYCRTELSRVMSNMEKLGKFFIITRRKCPSLPHSFLTKSRWLLPSIFFGKVFVSAIHAIHAKKSSKFLYVLPLTVLVTFAFCHGAWKELNKH